MNKTSMFQWIQKKMNVGSYFFQLFSKTSLKTVRNMDACIHKESSKYIEAIVISCTGSFHSRYHLNTWYLRRSCQLPPLSPLPKYRYLKRKYPTSEHRKRSNCQLGMLHMLFIKQAGKWYSGAIYKPFAICHVHKILSQTVTMQFR